MGIINVFKGLDLDKEIYNFNGSVRENLDLNWEYTKIYKGSEELTPDYQVQEGDILTIQEFPAGTGTGSQGWDIFLGVITLGIYTSITAYNLAKKSEKEMKDALKRLEGDNKKNELSSIPQLSGGKNERADGKNAPIIIGRHLFTPYFLSDPYLRPAGTDGKDLYWYATFIAGQNGICIEKIRNGMNDLIANFVKNTNGKNFNDNKAQHGKFLFDKPVNYNYNKPPPFFDFENFAEIAQDGYSFTEEIFEQKWVDSLDSSVELGRIKKENAKVKEEIITGNIKGGMVDDDGPDLIIRETARFPMRAEIEILIDGLNGWDSKYSEETEATIGVKIGWSERSDSREDEWKNIPITWERIIPAVTYPASTSPDELRARLAARFGYAVSDTMTFNFPTGGSIGGQYINNIKIIMFISAGHYYITFNNGSVLVHTVANFENDYYPYLQLNKVLILNSQGNNVIGGEFITRKKSEQMRFIAEVDFFPSVFSKTGNPVFIRATRTTKMYSGGYRDRVYLSAIRTQQYNQKTSSNTNLVAAKNLNERLVNKFCRIGIKIKANKNTQEAMDRFNIIASMTARTWNGTSWSAGKTKTSNPAAAALEILTGLIHDLSKYDDSEINLKSFGDLYRHCMDREVKIEGETLPVKFNLEANGVLTSGTKKLDALRSVLAVCDAGLYIDEFGKFHVYHDDKQFTPIALLNPQIIVKINESKSFERVANGYTVEFINEEADWSSDFHQILRPFEIEGDPLNFYTPIKLDFTTSYKQAMWHARRMMAKEIHRKGELKITVGKEGRLYKPGSLIKVQHEGLKRGLGSGEIMQVLYSRDGNSIIGFKMMEKFDIAKDRDYFVEYFVVNKNENHVVCSLRLQSVGKYTDILLFATSVTVPADSWHTPELGNPLSVLYGNTLGGNVYEAKRYVVSELSENTDGYDLTLFAYSDYVYDETGEPIPEYHTSILNAPPLVINGQMVQRNGIDYFLRENAAQAESDHEEIKKIPQSVTEISSEVTAAKSPRYRGVFFVVGLDDGTINHTIMNPNDWVLYLGPLSGNWSPEYCYRWTGEKWERIPFDEMDKYQAALSDITNGRPNAAYMAVFCRMLWAQKAMITELQTKIITLMNGGAIKSANWTDTNGDAGFMMDGNTGNVWFNDGTFRGELKGATGDFTGKISALSGSFKNGIFTDVEIKGNSILRGDIDNGVLKVTHSTTTTFTVNDRETYEEFWNRVANGLDQNTAMHKENSFTLFPTSGTYGSWQIANISFQITEAVGGSMLRKLIIITTPSGSVYTWTSNTTVYHLTFTVGTTGRTIRMVGLAASTAVQDEVYKYTTNLIPGVNLLAIR